MCVWWGLGFPPPPSGLEQMGAVSEELNPSVNAPPSPSITRKVQEYQGDEIGTDDF